MTEKQDKGLREILDDRIDGVRQTCSECNHPRCHGIINSLEVTLNVWHRQAIEQAITAHTNAEIAKVLDRLESERDSHDADTGCSDEQGYIPLSAIEAERAKLKVVK